MKKILFIAGLLIFIFAVVILIVIFYRNSLAKNAISAAINKMTGLELQMQRLDIGILKPHIQVDGVKIFNLPNFNDKVMAELSQIYIDYDLGAFLKKKVHLREVKINLKEFLVEQNPQGQLNINSLKVIKESKKESKATSSKEKASAPEIQIDVLELKIGKVIYKDYSQQPPQIQEFNLDIDERYENITDLNSLARLILFKALVNTTIPKITDFILGTVKSEVSDILKKSEDLLKQTTKDVIGIPSDTLKKATEDLKNIFGPIANEEK